MSEGYRELLMVARGRRLPLVLPRAAKDLSLGNAGIGPPDERWARSQEAGGAMVFLEVSYAFVSLPGILSQVQIKELWHWQTCAAFGRAARPLKKGMLGVGFVSGAGRCSVQGSCLGREAFSAHGTAPAPNLVGFLVASP